MSIDTGAGPSSQDTGQEMCQICFSTSHTTENCDVKREGHMIEVQRWTEGILPALAVRAEKETDQEGVTDYRLYDANTGRELGELEVLDEERALRIRDIKALGGWGSMLTFHFIAPDGSSRKFPGAPQPIEQILGNGISYLRGEDKLTPEQESARERREDEGIAKDWGLTPEEWQFMKKTRVGLLHEAASMSGGRGKSRDFSNLIDRWQGRFSATNETKDTLYMSDSDLEDRVFNQNMSPEEKARFMEKFGTDLPEYKRISTLVAENELKKTAKKRGVPVEDWLLIHETGRDIDRLGSTLDFNGSFSIHELSMGWRLRRPDDARNQEREQKLLTALNPEQKSRFDAIKTKAARYHEIWDDIDTRESKS